MPIPLADLPAEVETSSARFPAPRAGRPAAKLSEVYRGLGDFWEGLLLRAPAPARVRVPSKA